MELMQALTELISSGEFYMAVAAIIALLKALAEALEYLGGLRKGKDWADNLAGKALWAIEELGKIGNWFAPGNKTEQPGIVIRILQLFKK